MEHLLNYSAHEQKLFQEYKDVIDRSVIVSKTDTHGIITFVNEKFCQISGYSREELIGQSHNIIRHPDMSADLFHELWQNILNLQPWEGIVKNRKKDGTSYWVHSVINPLFDAEGNISEFIAIRQDVTELEEYKLYLKGELDITSQDIVNLNQEIINTQREVIYTLGSIAETRSQETGLHVKRVAEYSYLLAKLYGLSEEESILLKHASPMHDIGKVGIPDHILNKPGKFTPEEFEIMKTHAELGYEMLKHSKRDILKASAVVAYTHHERWDGSGYPRGLSADEIPIYGRITAVADVFDALGHDRIYKAAWPLDKILDLFREERGKHFDPNMIDLFFEYLDQFLAIRNRMQD